MNEIPATDSTSDESCDAAGGDDRLVQRFLAWLQAARDEAAREHAAAADDDESDRASLGATQAGHGPAHDHAEHEATCEHEAVGLYRLVEEFTALRQEIKLQAKGARGLEDQVGALLPKLERQQEAGEEFQRRIGATLEGATRALAQATTQATAGGGGPLQALALAVADLDDALDRGRRQMERAADELTADPLPEVRAAIDAAFARQSTLARWAGRRFYDEVLAALGGKHDSRRSQLVAALLDGYGLIQQRLTRLMAKEEIARIVVVGQPVDPELMVVVEAVDAANGVRPGTVVEEVRRGYLWRGKLLRYAEVKATRVGSP